MGPRSPLDGSWSSPRTKAAATAAAGDLGPAAARLGLPWVGVNSAFYIGPDPPRAAALDLGPFATILQKFLGPDLDRATLVLHASDQELDFGFDGLRAHDAVGTACSLIDAL